MVTTDVNTVTYNGNGSRTAFPFTFKIQAASEINLQLVYADGTVTDITSDFYVDTVNSTVHYPGYAPGSEPAEADRPAPVQTGQKLTIWRDVPMTQEADLGDKWPFEKIENGLDKLTMICQQIYAYTNRKLDAALASMFQLAGIVTDSGKLQHITDQYNAIDNNAALALSYKNSAVASKNAAAASETNAANSAADATTKANALTNIYNDAISQGTIVAPAVDATLSISGAAADAKATGDAVDLANGTLYSDGVSVTIQVNTAETIVRNAPDGVLHVKNTSGRIYTGPPTLIDLLRIKSGSFTDPTTGVNIDVTGTEVYIHGNASAGFRFDLQKGEFFTDSFANHFGDFSQFPTSDARYRLCWYEKDGYTAPTNIYMASMKDDGTLKGDALSAHSAAFYINKAGMNGQYIAIYSNSAINGINIKFTIGMKLNNIPAPPAGYSIEEIAKMPQGVTNIITGSGYYKLGEYTWTTGGVTYTAVRGVLNTSATDDALMGGRVFAWFGDSLSQLLDLPTRVSNVLNVTVHDCTFAGAPLTYGDPTKYEPTGFMSLASQIVAGNFNALSSALDAQEDAGINVTEKRAHLATLQSLDFNDVTDIVIFAGTNDFRNNYVNATKFKNGFTAALNTLLTAYPHLIVYVLSPTWRGVNSGGVETIPTMEDIVSLEKQVAEEFSLPFYDLYHKSGINAQTAAIYLGSDLLHPTTEGDILLANKCAKFLRSN